MQNIFGLTSPKSHWNKKYSTLIINFSHTFHFNKITARGTFWERKTSKISNCFRTLSKFFQTSSKIFSAGLPKLHSASPEGFSGVIFSQTLSQHTCEACGQPLPAKKTPYCSRRNSNFNTTNQTPN